jgi:hypothetical protein
MVLTVGLQASDMVGVYGVVEKVVVEPADAPARIQIWGAFALSDQKSGSTYGTAQRGYLYYTCPQGKETICRKEWADLKSMAGTNLAGRSPGPYGCCRTRLTNRTMGVSSAADPTSESQCLAPIAPSFAGAAGLRAIARARPISCQGIIRVSRGSRSLA